MVGLKENAKGGRVGSRLDMSREGTVFLQARWLKFFKFSSSKLFGLCQNDACMCLLLFLSVDSKVEYVLTYDI